MRHGVARLILAVLLAVLAAGFPATGIAFAIQNSHTARQADTVDTRDLEFLKTIRFANLWEIPMSRLALDRGTTKEVKDAATTMLADHTKLNTIVQGFADKFGMTLPNQPTSSQQTWMGEISGRQGQDFDRTFVNRFRGAHGSIFQAIAEERAGTRNQTMLDFATQANAIVLRHMTLLEKTGYVSGPTGHFAEAAARTMAYPENQLSASDIVLGGLLFVLVAAGTVFAVRTLSTGTAS